MDATTRALRRTRRLAQAVSPSTAPVDEALPALRGLLDAAGARYKLVGGIAVVHHGYARLTDDIDVLLDAAGARALDPILAHHGFERVSPARLRHGATGVPVDLLVGGAAGPRPGDAAYPDPDAVDASPADPRVVGLRPLLEMKLRARRYQDLADAVRLLMLVDDARYNSIGAAFDPPLRPDLARLRRDALQEARWRT